LAERAALVTIRALQVAAARVMIIGPDHQLGSI